MRLPEYITDAINKGETSLGDNPAFPPGITGGKFLDTLLFKRFSEVSKPFEGKSLEEIQDELYSNLNKCKDVERSCKPALEKLCGDIVGKLFKFPEDTLTIDMELSENAPSHKMRLEPDSENDFSFDSIEDMGYLSDEIYKRRMCDALVEGASEYYAYDIQNYVQELFKIQPELPSLYSKVIEASQYLTLTQDDTNIDATSTDGGYVIVKVGQKDEMPAIEARGSIFPILLQQTIKGVLEIAVLGGLPKDKDKARYVMSRSDFSMAQKWDSRLGYPLWQKVSEAVEKSGNNPDEVGLNFILMELSNANTEIFNKTLQEVFAGTNRGTSIIKNMCEYITEQKEEDEFNDYIEQTNTKYPIEDGYFTAEELIRNLDTMI
ncbi:MAG: hypothetical protein J6X18_05180 [Bacteroidales bacterium]|nr:hypothetical protein [Bacteroidales bacterium]